MKKRIIPPPAKWKCSTVPARWRPLRQPGSRPHPRTKLLAPSPAPGQRSQTGSELWTSRREAACAGYRDIYTVDHRQGSYTSDTSNKHSSNTKKNPEIVKTERENVVFIEIVVIISHVWKAGLTGKCFMYRSIPNLWLDQILQGTGSSGHILWIRHPDFFPTIS